MHPRAFTLVELLVYSALLGVFALVAFSYVTQLSGLINGCSRQTETEVREAVLQDMVLKDVIGMDPTSGTMLVKYGVFYKQALSKKNSIHDVWVGYQVADGCLVRSEGQFDAARGSWGKRQVAYFKTQLHRLTLVPTMDSDGYMRLMTVSLTDAGGSTRNRYVRLRNGVVA